MLAGMASGSGGLLGWAGVLTGSGDRSLGRKVELWSLRELISTGLEAGKLAVVTVTLDWVATGSWDQTQVLGGSCGGDGSKSLSQTLDKVCLKLARASWLPWEGREGSWPSLSELVAAMVVMV